VLLRNRQVKNQKKRKEEKRKEKRKEKKYLIIFGYGLKKPACTD